MTILFFEDGGEGERERGGDVKARCQNTDRRQSVSPRSRLFILLTRPHTEQTRSKAFTALNTRRFVKNLNRPGKSPALPQAQVYDDDKEGGDEKLN